jgi:hypothetical protein
MIVDFLQFSLFVVSLCGFHTYIITISLTTQEKLKHVYDRFPVSPFGFGSFLKEWSKVILFPKRKASFISHALYLKCNEPKKFEEFRKEIGDKNLPEEMIEMPVTIYEEAFVAQNNGEEPFIGETGHRREQRKTIIDNLPDWASRTRKGSSTLSSRITIVSRDLRGAHLEENLESEVRVGESGQNTNNQFGASGTFARTAATNFGIQDQISEHDIEMEVGDSFAENIFSNKVSSPCRTSTKLLLMRQVGS